MIVALPSRSLRAAYHRRRIRPRDSRGCHRWQTKTKLTFPAACRSALRIPADYTGYDEEIADLVSAARSALVAGGVSDAKANSDDDASVRCRRENLRQG